MRVEVLEWVGEIEPYGELLEVWIQIRGLPPKWCDWKVFAQVVSGFSIMTEVDWARIFKSFYEVARVKVACRDPKKIPSERLFRMMKKLYLLSFSVEHEQQMENNGKEQGNDDDDKGDGDEDLDEVDDLDDEPNNNAQDENMNLDRGEPRRSRTPISKKLPPTSHYKYVKSDGDEIQEMLLESALKMKESEATQQSRWEVFKEVNFQDLTTAQCVDLLREMELAESEDEGSVNEEEHDVFSVEVIDTTRRNLLEDFMKYVESQQKKKEPELPSVKWGPTLRMERPRRHVEDGRTILQKAEDYIKQKNLKNPQQVTGISFAHLDTLHLAKVSNAIDLSMGVGAQKMVDNIEKIKNIELEQNQKFTDANSKICLPNNLDVDLPLDKFPPLNGVNPPKDTAFNAENPEESNSES